MLVFALLHETAGLQSNVFASRFYTFILKCRKMEFEVHVDA